MLDRSILAIFIIVLISMPVPAMAQDDYLTGAEEAIQDPAEISQEKGVDQRVDYQSLTEFGPWDDRNYTVTLEDLSLIPENDQFLRNVPVFFKIQLRKEQPDLGEFYPRSALQSFQIRHGGLSVNGILYKDGLGIEYSPDPVEEEEPCGQ